MLFLRHFSILILLTICSLEISEANSQVKSPNPISNSSHVSNLVPCDKIPTLNCPPNLTLCIGADIHPNGTGCAKATAGGPHCPKPIVSYVDNITSEGPCHGEKIIQRTWNAIDPEDPTVRSFCIQYIYLEDKRSPDVNHCPTDTTVLTNEKCHALVSWTTPCFTDHCSNFCVKASHANGSTFNIGTTNVVFTATDACGNTATCAFNINVIANCCNQAPSITCPQDFNGCPQDANPSVTGIAIAIPSSVHCAQPVIAYSDDTLHFSQCSIKINRTWTATDPNDHTLHSSCIQKIEMLDVASPTITCPSSNTVQSGADCKAIVHWTSPTTTDNCSAVQLTSTYNSGDKFEIGTTTVTYTATDACGHTASCTFQITVTDNCCNEPPKITVPADYKGCPSSIDPSITGTATASSAANCNQALISYVDEIIVSTTCSTYVKRTWLAIDPDHSNLRDSASQIIELSDDQNPTITCPSSITVQSGPDCKAVVNWTNPTSTDNCSTVQLTSTYNSGDKFEIGTTTVTYTATDACGHTASCTFQITVTDNCCNEPPKITVPADYKGCPSSIDPAITGTATASSASNCNQALISYVDEIIVSTTCSTYVKRTWLAIDPDHSNLRDSALQIIELSDDQNPTITCPSSITVQSGPDCKAAVNWTNPTTIDNCSTVQLTSTYNSGDKFEIGTTIVTYTATDACGHTASCTFQITVTDNCCNEPPKITVPADYKGCPSSIDPSITGTATASSAANCNQALISYVDEINVSTTCSSYVKRTWLAIDPDHSNLRDSTSQIIELSDDQNPTITCPSSITVQSGPDCKAVVNWTNPTSTDNCSTVQLTSTNNSGDIFEIGTTTITFTATDACGHSASCTFQIEVTANCCNRGPSIVCPQDFSGCPGSIETVRTGTATASKGNSLCDEPLVSYRDIEVHQIGCSLVIDRTWIAIDPNNSSLRDSCVQRIELKDEIAPVISGCPTDIEVRPGIDCNAEVNWTIPTADDNCSLVSLSGTHLPGLKLSVGKIKVIYTATDACNNTSTCTFNIEVLNECCNKPPVINCPADYRACPNTSISKEITGEATVSKGTSFCNDPIITFSDKVLSSGPCNGAQVIERTWTATDPDFSNYTVSCIQKIELVDKTVPEIEHIADMNINANGQCEIKVTLPQAVVTDNCGVLSITSDKVSGSIFNMGSTRVTYTATDSCGNSSTRSFNVNVTGSVISINCPKDTIIYRANPYIDGAYYNWSIPKVRHCSPCKDSIKGFIYMGEYAGNRYFCSLAPATWNDAKILCKLHGGDLAKITSQEENQYISGKLMGQVAWIGANDENKEGRFDWVDGSQVTYSNWAVGQPNNGGGNENYVELHPNGTWNDNIGNVSREFICQVPCYKITQTEGPKSGSLFPCGNNKITYVAEKDGKRDTCSFKVKVDCDSISKYCKNGGQHTDILWIDRVSLASINNVSGDNKGYAYFNKPCPTLSNGIEYELCVEPGYKTTAYVVYWKVWIDYNLDGVFHNSELFLTGQGSTGLCGKFTLPSTISSGQTRMRIAMSYGKHVSDACGFILYGEVEDYCIELKKLGTLNSNGNLIQNKLPIEMKCTQDCDTRINSNDSEINKNEIQVINSIEVIPNPVINEMQLLSKGRNVKIINIYNSNGKLVFKKIAPINNKELLDVSQWLEGMYFVSVEFENHSVIVEKFLIQK